MSTSVQPRLMPLLIVLALFVSLATASAQDSTRSLVLNPDSLVFTNAKLGVVMTKTFTLRNRSSDVPLIISVGQPNSPLFNVESERQFTLAKGQTKTVTISFLTTIPGNFNAILPIENTAFDQPSPIEFKLRGEARQELPHDSLGLRVTPDPVAFGNVRTGASRLISMVVRNASAVRRFAGTISAPGAPFSIESGAGAFDLSPGQSQIVAIRFSPTATGVFLDSLTVHGVSTDNSQPEDTTMRIRLAGRGTDGPVASDTMALLALPDTVDFGTSSGATTMERMVVIVNNSASDTLSGVIGTTSTGSFTLASGGDFFKLAPGEAQSLAVRFAPTMGGALLDSIVASYSSQNSTEPVKRTTVILKGFSPNLSVLPAEEFGYHLGQNYPNPVNESTTIDIDMAKAGEVAINLYDAHGRLVRPVYNARLAMAGRHTIKVDATGLPAGVYIYRMESGRVIRTREMIVIH